ncbi:NGG1p interacting factor 3 protein, NIF3 [Nitritalea halalkaliphila LW7]|uniref:GTP cyclohydrolase 1 type 2 homolog n=1 Tax=Nitritalea halalkaliphila LW7 TaxID=1189621 RepID=I5C639_9BACT|nr:Nif3-like dinuclear metal center hexameric protein [Nitritalea halalkaliphila]EIM77291.1 NGG1p interacting factor 3 protein, NIF3 [Nitritalea halalkaliphila LW7]
MGYLIRELLSALETLAPPAYQESYDNAGLIVGDADAEVRGVLCALDVTEEVVEEAIRLGCNLIVAHHPIVFKGLKRLTGANYVERTVLKAIRADVALYAIHTNLDAVLEGVNGALLARLGVHKGRILAPKGEQLLKLITFVPHAHREAVSEALFQAGAGQMGAYSACSFYSEGTGTFKGGPDSQAFVGEKGQLHREPESKLEVLLPRHRQSAVLRALLQAHPYEEVAYDLLALENRLQEVGSGMVGELPEPMEPVDFLHAMKKQLDLVTFKHTALPAAGKKIRRVAVCGGSGIFLLGAAKAAGADIFITSDIKYHEFFDADNQLILCDIGHYESEVHTKELLKTFISKKFPNIALYLTSVITNPITYF